MFINERRNTSSASEDSERTAAIARNVSMLENLFPIEGWRAIALIFQILVWILGVAAVLFQIVVFVAKTNIDTLQEAPRIVTHAPALQPHSQVQMPPVTVITFGYGEPEKYTAEIIKGLRAASFDVRPPMHVGFRPDAPSGLTVVPNGHDATQLIKSLEQANIKYNIGQINHVPPSAWQTVSDSIVLEIGAK